MAGLRAYNSKRDFTKTAEPAGAHSPRRAPASAQVGAFCVQKHAARRLHYDLRLEMDGVLKSWAVPKGPSRDPRVRRLAIQVEDHPLEYGSFEGVIPKKEYGGGTVMLWDAGRWTAVGDARRGYREGELKFTLSGRRLVGAWVLVRTRPGPGEEDKQQWLLIKERDEWARSGEPNLGRDDDRSSASNRTMAEIAAGATDVARRPDDGARQNDGRRRPETPAKPPPETVGVSLATLVDEPPEGDDWVHEIKYDGYRILARLHGGGVRLFTRNGIDWTARFPALAKALEELPVGSAWLDGEVVAFDRKGLSDFSALQKALAEGQDEVLTYVVFDLLHHDGDDTRQLPLLARKERLVELLGRPRGGARAALRFSEHIVGDGRDVFSAACRHHLEGVVSKRADSSYAGRRTRSWLKCKCGRRQELVIGGYTEPSGSRRGFGALLVGTHDPNGALRYAGRVGSGFSDATLARLAPRLQTLERRSSPFRDPPTGTQARGVRWVTPRLTAEVQFAEWTPEGLLRQPVFKGLRLDKPAPSVKRERGARRDQSTAAPSPAPRRAAETVAGVAITHPERLVFADAGLTKLDVVRYYEAVAERLLPHLAHRPLTVVRCPEGTAGQCFFQKHPGASLPRGIARLRVDGHHGAAAYPVVDTVEALITMVQLGALEFHVWGSQASSLETPDQVVFDLDPDVSVEWRRVRAAARRLRDELAHYGLQSVLKTSGGKGLHVVVPLRREAGWPAVAEFARSVAEAMVESEPDRYTATMSKAKRAGKVFVDHFRNGRGATAVAPYSLRARAGAAVALPIGWEELGATVSGDAWTVARVLRRMRAGHADPWNDFASLRSMQKLPGAGLA